MASSRRHVVISLLVIAGCAAIAIGFAVPLIYYCQRLDGQMQCQWAFNRMGQTDDNRMFFVAWEAARVALHDFHQFPSWNPYHGGGIVLYQDPQTAVPSPLFWLTLWLPTAAAMKTWLLVHLVVGALGARMLVKDRGANCPEQILAATLVSACGFCAEHFGGGHASFAAFLYLPWILWSNRRALSDPRWSVLTALLLANAVWEGGTYPVPLMSVALGLDVLAHLGAPDDRRALARSIPILAMLFVLLASVRLLPVLAFLEDHPRIVPLDDQMTVAEVIATWITPDHARAFPPHVFVWPEFGNYVGVVPVVLAGLGLAHAVFRVDPQTRARRMDAYVFVALVWCALGNVPGFSLFGVLHQLPVFDSLRVPSRFEYPATVLLATLVVWALIGARDGLAQHRVRGRWLRLFMVAEIVLTIGVATTMFRANSPRLQQGLAAEVPTGHASAEFFQDPSAEYDQLDTFPVRGIGTRTCYAAFDWPVAPGLWLGREAQERMVPPDAGHLSNARWSPNAVTVHVQLDRAGTVVVNQNFDSNWHVNAGALGSRQGLLAVDLPAGEYDLAFTHFPRRFWPGLVLTLLGFVLSALIVWPRLRPWWPGVMARANGWVFDPPPKALPAPEPVKVVAVAAAVAPTVVAVEVAPPADTSARQTAIEAEPLADTSANLPAVSAEDPPKAT